MSEVLATQTLLKIGDAASPEVFSTILDVVDLSPPGFGVDTEEITSHSNSDKYREFAATLIDSGEVSFTVLWDPSNTGHQGLITDLTGRTKRNFELVFPDADQTNDKWSFSGYFTAFEPEVPLDEHLKANITIKVTGSVTIGNSV